MELSMNGKVAIVFAASKGIGKATAKELVNRGASVMIAARTEKDLQTATEELTALERGQVRYTVADMADKQAIESVVEQTIEQFGRLDILVNNVGGPPGGTFEDFTDEDWEQAFQLIVLSFIRSIRAALPYLKKQGGHIINVTSTSVKVPIPGLLLSNALRLSVVGLGKTLASELAPDGILVNTVAPGRTATDRMHALNQRAATLRNQTYEEVEANSVKDIPLGRYATPEEFAKAVAFLVSDDNTYITGSTLAVDGGLVTSI